MDKLPLLLPILAFGLLMAVLVAVVLSSGNKRKARHRGGQPRQNRDDNSSWVSLATDYTATSTSTSNANPLDALHFHQTHTRHRADDDTRRDYHQSQDVEAWDSHPSNSSSETICGGDIGSSSSDSDSSSDSGSSDSGDSGD